MGDGVLASVMLVWEDVNLHISVSFLFVLHVQTLKFAISYKVGFVEFCPWRNEVLLNEHLKCFGNFQEVRATSASNLT